MKRKISLLGLCLLLTGISACDNTLVSSTTNGSSTATPTTQETTTPEITTTTTPNTSTQTPTTPTPSTPTPSTPTPSTPTPTTSVHNHEYNNPHYELIENELFIRSDCLCGEYELLEVDTSVAVPVSTEADLRTVALGGFDIILSNDITLTSRLDFTIGDVTLDLNKKVLTTAIVEEENGMCFIHVNKGATLTVTGNGEINLGETEDEDRLTNVAICAYGGTLNILNGKFINGGFGNALIYSQHNGIVNIYDGYFYVGSPYNGVYYTLNTDESNKDDNSSINVFGGQFVNFNPAAHHADGGTKSFLASDEYHSIPLKDGDNTIYTISKHTLDEKIKYDDNSHWNACEHCDFHLNEQPHSFENLYDETNHYEYCECGYITNVVSHELVSKHTLDGHYEECSCGYKTKIMPHTLTNNHNETSHYQSCECGYKTEEIAHTWDQGTMDSINRTGRIHTCECGATNIKTTMTLYFTNSWQYSKVNIYLFNKKSNSSDMTWPGIEMTYVADNAYGEKIYSIEVDLSKYDMCVFSDNGGNQLADTDLYSLGTNNAYYPNWSSETGSVAIAWNYIPQN